MRVLSAIGAGFAVTCGVLALPSTPGAVWFGVAVLNALFAVMPHDR